MTACMFLLAVIIILLMLFFQVSFEGIVIVIGLMLIYENNGSADLR